MQVINLVLLVIGIAAALVYILILSLIVIRTKKYGIAEAGDMFKSEGRYLIWALLSIFAVGTWVEKLKVTMPIIGFLVWLLWLIFKLIFRSEEITWIFIVIALAVSAVWLVLTRWLILFELGKLLAHESMRKGI